MHTYIHTCIHAHMHACIHAYIHTCTHAYINAYMNAYTSTCMFVFVLVCVVFVFVCVCVISEPPPPMQTSSCRGSLLLECTFHAIRLVAKGEVFCMVAPQGNMRGRAVMAQGSFPSPCRMMTELGSCRGSQLQQTSPTLSKDSALVQSRSLGAKLQHPPMITMKGSGH